jgi:hypothetical protein
MEGNLQCQARHQGNRPCTFAATQDTQVRSITKCLLEDWLGCLPIALSALSALHAHTRHSQPRASSTPSLTSKASLQAHGVCDLYPRSAHDFMQPNRFTLCSADPVYTLAPPPLYRSSLHREHVRAAITVHAHITPDLHHDIRADHDALCRRWKSTARPAHAHLTSRLSYCSPGRAVIGLTSSVSPSRRPGKRRASSTTIR